MSPARLHPAVDGNRCKDIEPNIRMSSESLMEGLEGRIELARSFKHTTKRSSELTNLGPWVVTEIKPTKKDAGVSPGLSTHL